MAHVGAPAAHLACAFADDALAVGARRPAAVAPFYFVDRRVGVQAYDAVLDAHLDGRAELAV